MKKPVLHQLKTKGTVLDGMSYVIECGDGQIVVIDGAMPNDAEDLYQYLKKLSGKEVPEVAAWIITHLHIDHDGALIEMGKIHAKDLIVKQFICRYPCQEMIRKREPGVLRELPLLETAVEAFGCERIVPTTGDHYTFGKVDFEVMFTCAEFTDPEYRYNINETSTVLKMTAEGQSIMFLGDSEPAANKIMLARHSAGKLKSDVVQVAHHGCCGSTDETYRTIDAQFVLWPVNPELAKIYMFQYSPNRAIFSTGKVKDCYIAGDGTRRWELPITSDYAPFVPEVPSMIREIIPEREMKEARCIPDLKNPLDPAWEQSQEIDVCGSCEGKPNGAYGRLRVLWTEDALYLRVSYYRDPIVSDPDAVAVDRCNNLRIHMVETPIREMDGLWDAQKEDPNFMRGLLVYPEAKNLPGGPAMNSKPKKCESYGFTEGDHYHICAGIQFHGAHKKGDIIGFHMETNGVEEKGGRRTAKMMLCTEGLSTMYRFTPGCIMLWELV